MGKLRDYLKKIANPEGRISNKFRKNRFSIFLRLINSLNINSKELNILDVGGTVSFWRQMEFVDRKNIKITILNLGQQKYIYSNIKCVIGNGCNMKTFNNNEFDITFSNSVIEHVGTYQNREKMAKEIQRVGKSFFIQTPNYWFPFEPHFLTFGFQFLPIKVRAYLLRNFDLGWFSKIDDYQKSIEVVNSIRLLRKNELKKLFPNATIIEEKFLGLTKSFMVYKL